MKTLDFEPRPASGLRETGMKKKRLGILKEILGKMLVEGRDLSD
jgi:hypothetical protein